MVRAGLMRERIVVQQPNETRDATYGGIESAFTTFATRWARAIPLSGNERFTEDREFATQQVRFELRELTGVTTKMEVVWDGRRFDIVAVLNPEGRNRETHLQTVEQDA